MTQIPRVNWQPLVESLAFAVKAGALVTVVALLNASNPDITELRSGAMGAALAGLARYFGDHLPPAMRV